MKEGRILGMVSSHGRYYEFGRYGRHGDGECNGKLFVVQVDGLPSTDPLRSNEEFVELSVAELEWVQREYPGALIVREDVKEEGPDTHSPTRESYRPAVVYKNDNGANIPATHVAWLPPGWQVEDSESLHAARLLGARAVLALPPPAHRFVFSSSYASFTSKEPDARSSVARAWDLYKRRRGRIAVRLMVIGTFAAMLFAAAWGYIPAGAGLGLLFAILVIATTEVVQRRRAAQRLHGVVWTMAEESAEAVFAPLHNLMVVSLAQAWRTKHTEAEPDTAHEPRSP